MFLIQIEQITNGWIVRRRLSRDGEYETFVELAWEEVMKRLEKFREERIRLVGECV